MNKFKKTGLFTDFYSEMSKNWSNFDKFLQRGRFFKSAAEYLGQFTTDWLNRTDSCAGLSPELFGA
jgi:hypothetical protein